MRRSGYFKAIVVVFTTLLSSSSNAQNTTSVLEQGTGALTNNALVNEANKEKAQALSAEVLANMRKFRGGTDEFYADLLQALTVTMCDQKTKSLTFPEGEHNPKLRFVNEDDLFAYKDDNGNCVKVMLPEDEVALAYSQGLCEVKPNCYWAPIDAGVDEYRATVYDKDAARKLPEEGSLDFDESQAVLQKWVTGLVIFIAPGIVLSVLSLLSMILFIVCRCCCNKCGGRSPKPEGYSCMQKLLPIIFFFVFSAGIAATAGVALLFNSQVTNSVSDVFSISSSTLDASKTWISSAQAPLVDIRDTILSTVDDVKTELDNTEFIESGLDGLTSKLNEFGENTANVNLPRGCNLETDAPFCLACDACTTISESVSASSNEMEANAADGLEMLASTRSALNTELVDISSTIKNMVDGRVDATTELMLSIDDAKTSVAEVQTQWDSQDAVRATGVLAMFALGIIVVAIGIVGVVFGLTPLSFLAIILHIAYIIGFIALFLGFLVAAILIAFSVLLGDVCEITNVMTQDWIPLVGEDAGMGINACFQNTSLLEAYNLTDALDFEQAIEFPEGINLSNMLDFSEFDIFASEINAVAPTTFNVDQALMNNYLSVLNTYTGQNAGSCFPNDASYDLSNVLTPWIANSESNNDVLTAVEYIGARYSSTGANAAAVSGCTANGLSFECGSTTTTCDFEAFVTEVYTNVSSLRRIELNADQFVSRMKVNMTDVTTYVATFKSNITSLDEGITNIQDELVSTLYVHTEAFEDAMYCTFIADYFDELFNAMCGGLMPAFLMVSLMIFLMGIFLIPVNICLIILCKRLRASHGDVLPDETDFK